MFKQIFTFLFVVTLGFTVVVPQTHASDLSTALQRIDDIIAEMQSLRAEFVALMNTTIVSTPSPVVLGAVSGGVIGDDVMFGATNDDIKRIQKLLATDPTIYPYGIASGYFGPKTQGAIKNFQSRFDLDPVGVIGPSTRALLEVFFAAFPDGNYPVGVLTKPVPTSPTQVTHPIVPSTVTTKVLSSMSLEVDDGEYIVRSYTTDGTRNRDWILYPEDAEELITMIAKKLAASESEIRFLIDSEDLEFDKKSSSSHSDKNDAEDTLREKSSRDDGVDSIEVEVFDGEAKVVVEYKNGDNRHFTVQEDQAEDIISDVVDEIDMKERDVKDLIGFDYGDIDKTTIRVSDLNGVIRIRIYFDSGFNQKFTFDEGTDKDDMISDIAHTLTLSKRTVERKVDFN